MPRQSFSKKGFSTPLLMAVVAVVIIVVGYGIWHAKHHTTPAAKPATAAVVTKAVNGFLAIPQWQLKLQVIPNVKGAYYIGTPKTIDSGMAQQLNFFDTAIDSLKNKAGTSCKDSNYPLFTIVRYAAADAAQITTKGSQYYLPSLGVSQSLKFATSYKFSGYVPEQKWPSCEIYTAKNDVTLPDLTVGQHYSADQAAFRESLNLAQVD